MNISQQKSNFNTNVDRFSSLPAHWESHTDNFGRMFYVECNTRRMTWTKPLSKPAVGDNVENGEMDATPAVHPAPSVATASASHPLAAADGNTVASDNGLMLNGWHEQPFQEGRLFIPDHEKDEMMSVEPYQCTVRHIASPNPQDNSQSSISQSDPLHSGWEMRATSASRVYFVNHSTKTTTWEDPQLHSNLDSNMPQNKHDFRSKLVYFRSLPAMQAQPGICEIKVRRTHVLEDSYAEIMRQSPNDLKKKLNIEFKGETCVNYNDSSREFFFLLSHEIFNPCYGMFKYTAHHNYILQINPASCIDSKCFEFIGRCLSLFIFHCRFLDAYFTASFYKLILRKKVTFEDLECVDADLHHTLSWILENDITGVITNETFTVTEENSGKIVTIKLKPRGADIVVNEDNKSDYVNTIVEYYISKRVKQQVDTFMSGFTELIAQNLITIFDEHKLQLLIGGMSAIDVYSNNWIKFTEYLGYGMNNDVIQWFWECAHHKIFPSTKFGSLIHSHPSNPGVSRSADSKTFKEFDDHSQPLKSYIRFNHIDLPSYKNYAHLEQILISAISATDSDLKTPKATSDHSPGIDPLPTPNTSRKTMYTNVRNKANNSGNTKFIPQKQQRSHARQHLRRVGSSLLRVAAKIAVETVVNVGISLLINQPVNVNSGNWVGDGGGGGGGSGGIDLSSNSQSSDGFWDPIQQGAIDPIH
ncbi:hypothetical protein PILCRDRAFT_8620 [Piloderma croceum F 1598]|uniref:HECT-type E3 ubiquitin transferase n=1 Tax=Piloderma croceum (strain F 1598) TaxID=765440 RepID=A0A0C3FA86_PILCF|nr:hypothetical protein PILCRDRAFT_8620 [Piloderma croceum F 1598]